MFSRIKSSLLVAGAILAPAVTFAADPTPVTLPETGVDVAGLATAAITTLGAVVAVCIAGTIAFFLIRAGLKFVKRIA